MKKYFIYLNKHPQLLFFGCKHLTIRITLYKLQVDDFSVTNFHTMKNNLSQTMPVKNDNNKVQ